MNLDPARWSDRVQMLSIVVVCAAVPVGYLAGLPGFVGMAMTIVGPGVFGALIWRFGGAPWLDTASWTLAMTAWIVVSLALIPDPLRIPIAFGGVAVWLAVFLFWLPPVRLWFRWVLRKEAPG